MAADEKEVISSGAFPLHEAVIRGDFDAVQELTKKKPINELDGTDSTPLHYAALYGWDEIAEYLVSKGANCSLKNKEALIPLECAVRGKSKLKVLMFLWNGDVNTRRAHGKTLLHHAVREGDKRCIEFLIITKGADVNIRDDFGKTPLQNAIDAKKPEAIVILMKAGAKLELKADEDINVADEKGQTALHFAVMHSPFKVVAALLQAGAGIDAKDTDGNTPLDYAIQNKKLPAIAAFKKAGVKLEDVEILKHNKENRKAVQNYIDEDTPLRDRILNTLNKKTREEEIVDYSSQSEQQKSDLNEFLDCVKGLHLNNLLNQNLINLIRRLQFGRKSKERDQNLLEFCHQALWLDANYPQEGYSFFEVAIEHLEKGSRDKLKTTDEYRYFQKLKRIKASEKGLYQTMQAFDSIIQQAGFTAEEKRKSYWAANMQMRRALYSSAVFPVSKPFEQIYTELSSKGKTSKETSGLLGCMAGLLNVATGVGCVLFGVAGILASMTSVGATLGISSPIALAGIWGSGALIVSGVSLIVSGAVIAKSSLKRCQEGCREQENRGEQWKEISDTLIENVNEVVKSRERSINELEMAEASRESEKLELHQLSRWVAELKERVMSLGDAEEKNEYLHQVLENLENLSKPLETFCKNIRKPEIQYIEELDTGLLKLCHQALWIKYHFEDHPYNFFDIAVSLLQCHGNQNLTKTAEYHYLNNVNQLSLAINNEDNELLFDRKYLLDIAFNVEWAIQNSHLDKTELYKRANVQLEKILAFSFRVEETALNQRVKNLKAISEELKSSQVDEVHRASVSESSAQLLSSPMALVGNFGSPSHHSSGGLSSNSLSIPPINIT